MKKPITTVLFDLDGTLLDTAPDLAAALNLVLQSQNRAPLPYESIRPLASAGTLGLLNLGFQITTKDERYSELRTQFLNAYHHHLNENTTLFPGIADVLSYLDKHRFTWGIVTNKPVHLAKKLLEDFKLLSRCSCIIGGDMLGSRKPEPDSLLYACEIMGRAAAHCVYIGDAARDIEAARRANMRSIAVLYGYIGKDEDPRQWQADHYVQHAEEIINYL